MGIPISEGSEQLPAMRLLAVEGAQARVDTTDDPEELRLIVRELLSGFDFAPPIGNTNIEEIETSNSEETFAEIYCFHQLSPFSLCALIPLLLQWHPRP